MLGQVPKSSPWKLTEDEILRKLIADGRYAVDVAIEMSRSVAAVRMRAKQLALRFAAAPRGKPPLARAAPLIAKVRLLLPLN